MAFSRLIPTRHKIIAASLCLLKSICTVLAFGLPTVTSAQSTTAVNPDLSISIPVLFSNGKRTTAALDYQDNTWQLEIGGETSSNSRSATLNGTTLTLHCLLYMRESYQADLTQVNPDPEEQVYQLMHAESNPGCATDIETDLQFVPVPVPDYQLQDTASLLASVDLQLTGLPIADFFEESYALIRARDPDRLIADGNFDLFELETANLSNLSDAFYFQTTEIQSLIRNKLLSYNKEELTEEEQLSYDIYQAYLDIELEWAEYRDFDYPVTYGFFGLPGSSEQFFNQIYTITNLFEAELYLVLLNQTDRRFHQIGELLDARVAAGIIEPASTLSFSQSATVSMANSAPTATSYYQAFDSQLSTLDSISETDKALLREHMVLVLEQKVLPAYRTLSEKMLIALQSAPDAIGFGQYPGGDEFYDFTLRYYTSSNMDAEEIYLLGLTEMNRIHNEMDVLFNQLGYPQSETIAQKFTRVDQAAGTIFAEDALAFFEGLVAEAYTRVPDVFDQLPEQEVAVIGDTSGGFYIRGSDDGSRPGAFYADTDSDQAYTTLPSLAYHEAIPGHHLQIALANELDIPTFRRKFRSTSYSEGWALYAERLAKDLGWYDDDIYGDLGRLQFEAMRAARLVIDTGIHARGWTWTQANDYNIRTVGFPASVARFAVWPGQGTAYTTGMLKILELRDQAESALGDLYDIRDFHTAIIGHGAMPLYILEEVVEKYITNTSNTSATN